MASFKEFYTEQGKHCLQVINRTRRMGGISGTDGMQSAGCHGSRRVRYFPEEQSVVYDLSECVAISAYPILPSGELEKVAEMLRKFTEACKPYLLSAGSCSRELKHVFWNTRTAQLQCIYIPGSNWEEPEEWRRDVMERDEFKTQWSNAGRRKNC